MALERRRSAGPPSRDKRHLTTPNGDRIAFDRRGSGPALIFIAGAGIYREIDPWTTSTAEAAASRGITTVVYDRLGRGESPAEGRLDLDRELASLGALLEEVGGSAVLCGHSSGCSIALAAAVRGLPVDGLALWEPPLGPWNAEAPQWAAEFERLIAAGDLEGALAHYMKDMPPEWLEEARQSPNYPQLVAQVVSLRADAESLAWAESAPYAELFGTIDVPCQVMIGVETFPGMEEGAEVLAAAIPGAVSKAMPGADHSWEPEPMAAELVRFVREEARR